MFSLAIFVKIVIFYTEILTRKVDLWYFFHKWNKWKNPQFKFSSQNLSAERKFFKWDGKITKIRQLHFHRIWKNYILYWNFDSEEKFTWVPIFFTPTFLPCLTPSNNRATRLDLKMRRLDTNLIIVVINKDGTPQVWNRDQRSFSRTRIAANNVTSIQELGKILGLGN